MMKIQQMVEHVVWNTNIFLNVFLNNILLRKNIFYYIYGKYAPLG